VKFASNLTRWACPRQDDKSLRGHVADFVLKNHSGSLVCTFCCTKLNLFTFAKLWMLWFSSMAAVGTMALVMVYIREERLQMDSNSSFSRIDAMLMYLLGTMSGQGNFFKT